MRLKYWQHQASILRTTQFSLVRSVHVKVMQLKTTIANNVQISYLFASNVQQPNPSFMVKSSLAAHLTLQDKDSTLDA